MDHGKGMGLCQGALKETIVIASSELWLTLSIYSTSTALHCCNFIAVLIVTKEGVESLHVAAPGIEQEPLAWR